MSPAVAIVDMQNGFVHPDGSIAAVRPFARMQSVIEETAMLIAAAREAELPLVYLRHHWRDDLADMPARLRAVLPLAPAPLRVGTWDGEIHDLLRPERDDIVVAKNRFDGFLRTELDDLLSARAIDTLLVAGVATNTCVESTVRTAAQLDYTVSVASDCTTGHESFHEPALRSIAATFADVVTWREWLALVAAP